MEFVNRAEELEALSELLDREEPALIRFYGRRRLGKTEILRRLASERDGVYVLVDDADRPQLLDSISEQISNEANVLARPYASWDDVFDHLQSLDPPFVALDEFQRLVTNDEQAITRLQDRWDSELQNEGPSLILCGSSVGMMQRVTDRKQGPLFGRLTGDLKLEPFAYGAVRLLYPDLTEKERVRRFSVFGGTPHYHRFSTGETLEEAVRRSFLQTTSPFQEEPQGLLQLELKRPTRYNTILYEIGHGTHHLRELETKVGVSKGGLGPYLEVLRHDLDLVEMEDPVCGKQRKARYVFSDPFFAFYYRFVFGNRPRLELGRGQAVWEEIRDELAAFVGMQFEEVARQTIRLANGREVHGVPIEVDEIGRWWNRTGEELDLVAKGPEEVLAGEVKWSRSPVDEGTIHQTLERIGMLERTDGLPVRPVFVARNGLTDEAMEIADENHALVLDLEDITRIHDELFPTRT